MFSKLALAAAFALTAIPALAQPPAAAPSGGTPAAPAQPYQPTPAEVAAIQQAAQGFSGCIQGGVGALPATATAEAGAATLLAGCRPQLQSLRQAAEAMIAHMPADQAAAAHAQLEGQLGGIQAQIASSITAQRAAAAAAAAQPAAPAATPTPH